MPLRDRKLAVLHRLNLETEFISLEELMQKLGEGYADRSVRRWLADMIRDGLVERHGRKRGTKYQVVQLSWRLKETIDRCFGNESDKVVKQIRRPLFERNPIPYIDKWLRSYQPNITSYVPLELKLQLHKAGKRCKQEDPAGTYAHKIFNRLLIDLSYNSSRLEGNTYSLLDTQKLVLEGKGAEGKLDEEKVMILNHKDAIRHLVDTAPRLEVNKETICTLHYLLSDGLIEARYSGTVRDHGVRIGGSTYIPFEDPKELESRLDLITEIAASIHDPYEQSLFLLIHISYLQAFSDVNKRTARLSANIPLIKNNLVPLSFNDVERDDYMSSMIAVYELQDVRPILDLYLFSYMRTCLMYDSTIKAIGFDEIRVRYRQQRRALIRDIIINNLVGKPIMEYLTTQTLQLIRKEDRDAFLEDAMEDIKEMNQSRIAGLGITLDQLKTWIAANNIG